MFLHTINNDNKKYFYIILLWKITILFISVSALSCIMVDGKNVKTLSHLPAWQLENLAQDVCWDLSFYLNGTTGARCKSNFWKNISNLSSKPSTIQIKCQTKKTITFTIPTSTRWQLVILIADKYTDMEVINYSLLQPNTIYGELRTIPPVNYTIWSTSLDGSGFPYKWKRDQFVPEFARSSPAERKDYDIRVNYEKYNNQSYGLVDATVEWNNHNETDLSFNIMNICDNTEMYQTNLDTAGNRRVTLQRLRLDDHCEVLVNGLHGCTRHHYRTPSCDQFQECIYSGESVPDIPENVSLEANEYISGIWVVEVTWSKPKIKPDYYKVILRTDIETPLVLPGNATGAVFKDVVGKGMYNVSIYAFIGDTYAHTSRRSYFSRGHLWLWVSAAAGAWGTVALAFTAAMFCGKCHCRSQHPEQHPQPPEAPVTPQTEEDTEEIPEDSEVWKDQWEVRSDSVLVHEIVGEGAFGVVKRGTLLTVDMEVAIKMLKDFPTVEETRSFRAEIELMKTVGVHPHVVSLVGCCTGRKPFILVEYCSRGDLLSYLRCSWDVMVTKHTDKNNISHYQNNCLMWKLENRSECVVNKLYDTQSVIESDFSSKDLLSFCRQIAMGMQFLASNKVVHRDLAARNILVTSERTLKIADFGLSRDVYEESHYKQSGSGKLPLKWMALESLTRRIYTSQSDVWSFGVVMWEIVTFGGSPYSDIPAGRLVRQLRSGYRMSRPMNCSKELYQVMLSCWTTQPRDRPTFSDLYQQLDDMLSNACGTEYITLDLNDDVASKKPISYFKMLIGAKLPWNNSNNYERPVKLTSNYYISPSILAPKIQA